MGSKLSFKFAEDDLNRRLMALLKKQGIRYSVDQHGLIHYSPDDEASVENDVIGSIRDRVFSPWQVLHCPKDWVEPYKQYMMQHGIPFKEELNDGQLSFLLPRKYRPHQWKLEAESATAAN